METRKRVLGQEHPDTLTSMHNLAYTYNALGFADKAISLMTDVVALRILALGEEHPDTNDSKVALARWREAF
jgi:Tetratricopeptide repeat